MAIIDILANSILIVGCAAFAITLHHRRKQNYFSQLFIRLQKCQKYHLDYVESLSQLQKDIPVILFGTVKSLQNNPVITQTFLKKKPIQNRLWNFVLKSSFGMQTISKQLVRIQKSQQQILAFNLHKKQQNQKYESRIIVQNEPVCVYGLMKQLPTGRSIVPQLIMGTKHEAILQYLDQQIINLKNRGKIALIIGSLLFVGHFIYRRHKKIVQNSQKAQKLLGKQNENTKK